MASIRVSTALSQQICQQLFVGQLIYNTVSFMSRSCLIMYTECQSVFRNDFEPHPPNRLCLLFREFSKISSDQVCVFVQKEELLFNHCLLLARDHVYCCKFKNVSPCNREYNNSSIELKNRFLSRQTKKKSFKKSDANCCLRYDWHFILFFLLFSSL